jgi:hypothetical protein
MSYLGISVKEAIRNINNDVNGWFLPAIQRPYVWGSRYEKEKYICKLFDSILKRYPIGGIIIWNTEEKIPYREFITDFNSAEDPKLVDKGLYGKKDKCLVYDGQQRLQTLHSCLKYSFENKILVYDLLCNTKNSDEPDETGFSFVDKNEDIEWNEIRMNELYAMHPEDEKSTFRESIYEKKHESVTKNERKIIESNIDQLWDVFVKEETHSIAYFSIKTKNETVVNEIFQRLNTGGIALSLSDLLFTEIKKVISNFEEMLQVSSKQIYNITAKGYIFNAYNILQLIHLIVKKRVRVDPKLVKKIEIKEFAKVWDDLQAPLQSFFNDYLWGQFKINNNSIIPRKIAILPIIYYFYEIWRKGYTFKNIKSSNMKKINIFFIKSQVNAWDLQGFVDKFCKIITDLTSENDDIFEFPLEQIEEFISIEKKRNIDIFEETFIGYQWFALKILTPNRYYQFDPNLKNRFNPEIDHIFPKKLKDRGKDYAKEVDIIWNMQPTKGDINNFKSNMHPKAFFTDTAKNKKGEYIHGSKYVEDYDFLLPNKQGKIDFNDDIWNSPSCFIDKRRELMIEYLQNKYGIFFQN